MRMDWPTATVIIIGTVALAVTIITCFGLWVDRHRPEREEDLEP